MKNKLKIIIPIVTAIAAVIIALVCLSFKPQNKADMQSVLQTAQKYLTELNCEQAIAGYEIRN